MSVKKLRSGCVPICLQLVFYEPEFGILMSSNEKLTDGKLESIKRQCLEVKSTADVGTISSVSLVFGCCSNEAGCEISWSKSRHSFVFYANTYRRILRVLFGSIIPALLDPPSNVLPIQCRVQKLAE